MVVVRPFTVCPAYSYPSNSVNERLAVHGELRGCQEPWLTTMLVSHYAPRTISVWHNRPCLSKDSDRDPAARPIAKEVSCVEEVMNRVMAIMRLSCSAYTVSKSA